MSSAPRILRLLRLGAGWSALVGVSVVAGLVTDTPRLLSWTDRGTFTVMNAALASILAGAGLLALHLGWTRAARAAGWLVIGTCGVVLLDKVLGTDFGLDNLLWQHRHSIPEYPAGRMSPLSALAFLLAGVALVLPAGWARRPGVIAALGALILALGLLPLVQFGALLAFTDGTVQYRNLALPSAAALTGLAAALIALPGVAARRHAALIFWAAGLGMLFSVAQLAIQANQALLRVNRLLAQVHETREWLNHTVSSVARMESSARAYALTGGEHFAERVDVHIVRAREGLERLGPLLQGRPEELAQLTRMRLLTEVKFEQSLHLLRLRREQGAPAAAAYLSAMPEQEARELVHLHDLLHSAQENDLVALRQTQRNLESNIRIVLTMGGAMMVILLGGALALNQRANRARHAAELSLASTLKLQRAVLDGTVHSVISTTPEGLITLFSRGAERMLGYTAGEMVGRQTPQVLHAASEVAARAAELGAQLGRPVAPGFEAFVARARLGEVDEREWTYVRRDGTHLPVQLSVTALRDPDGKITGFLGIAQDLTERKRAEVALQASEERLGQVLGHAECLVWEAKVTLRGTDWDWSMSVYPSGLYGRLTQDYAQQAGSGLWYRFEIPEQQEMNQRSRQALEQGLPGYTQEFRLVKDGRTSWLRETVSIRPQGEDHFWLVGVAIDVTSRKQLEVALAGSEEQFRNAFDHAGIGMALVGCDGRWLRVNQMLQQMLGYGEQDLLARTFQDVTHPEDLPNELANQQELMAGRRQHFQLEKRYIHRDGRVVHARLTVSLVRDAAGQPRHLIAQAEDITARHVAEQALLENQRQLADIFRSMAEGLVVHNAQGRIIECNTAAETILGLTRRQMLGITEYDSRWHMLNPDGTPCPGDRMPSSITRLTGRPQRGVILGVHKPDGSLCWVSVNTEPIFDEDDNLKAVVASFADVTERKRAVEALTVSEERMRLFAEHAPASVAMFDREMRYLVLSAKWAKDYGLEGRAVIGRSHYEVFPEIGDHWKEIHRRCLAGATEVNEADLFTRADGTQQWLSWRVQPWHDARGEIGGIVMFTEDITRRKELEDHLALARDQALEASRLKSAFLANMSHEIRTPMNGVLGMVDLLMGTPLDGDQLQMGRTIQSSARNLLTIIDDILDFSKIEAGKLAIEPHEFDLVEQINQAQALLTPRARARGLSLQADLPAGPQPRLVGDAGRIQQVLVNLIGNAIKFTEKGGVTVCLLPQEARGPGRYAFRLEVHDTGIGISPASRARLFQPFVQADVSMTRKYGGTGLGLAISRQLVELMGGSIGCDSRLGHGSVFWFELELACGGADAAPAPDAPAAGGAALSALRVLVAEDNEANQLVIRLMLEKLGVGYDLVADGQEAVHQLARGDYKAVLMDCQMPGMDGYEATRQIRGGAAGTGRARVPIIALTAHAMASDREKCLAVGMDEYLAKPIQLTVLRDILQQIGIHTALPASTAGAGTEAGEPVLAAGQIGQLRNLPGPDGGSLLQRVIGMARQEFPLRLDEIHDLAAARAPQLADLAHKMAGSAANLGAVALRAVLKEIELAARKGDWAAVDRLHPGLDGEWRRLQAALERLVERPGA